MHHKLKQVATYSFTSLQYILSFPITQQVQPILLWDNNGRPSNDKDQCWSPKQEIFLLLLLFIEGEEIEQAVHICLHEHIGIHFLKKKILICLLKFAEANKIASATNLSARKALSRAPMKTPNM